MKELTYVNPYTWESERAKASTKVNKTTKRRNKRRPPGMTIMDRTINKLRKLREGWKKDAAYLEGEFRLGCGLPDRDSSLKPFTEEPFGTLYVPRNGGLCCLSEEVASRLSKSVVALALFDGDVMLFACTGIALPERTPNLKRFLTSARLAEVFNERRNKEDNLKITVRLPNKGSYDAFLELYDQDITIVTSTILWGVSPVDLAPHERDFQHTCLPAATKMVAAGRSFASCGLMGTTGTLTSELESMISACCITEAALGGPLVDLAGNFLGMNISCGSGSMCFMPRHTIVQRLYQFRLLENNPQNVQVGDYAGSSTGETKMSSWLYSMPPGAKRIKPSGFLRTLNHLIPLGYPEPPPLMLELDGQLLHKFEEDFGYLYFLSGHSYSLDSCCVGMNPWAVLDTETITTISRRVVSLSSYNGGIRFFSCTGLLIKCPANTDPGSHRRTVILTSASLVRTCDEPDTIDNNLKIEVFLPPKQRAIGTLESYDSHHNIAILSFKGLRAIRPEDISDHKQVLPSHVVAIAREPEQGLLCASTGKVTDKPITALPCNHLELSTCEIKKAGIGGPLINLDDGSFIGMNFYDGKTIGTPFLPRSKILEVLSGLELMPGRSARRGGDHRAPILDGRAETNYIKRWPVPQAYWHNELLKTDWDGDGFAWTRKFMEVNSGQ